MRELKRVFESSPKPPGTRRLVAITFDDAYRDFLDLAYPLLSKHQVPCTLFVPTGYLGRYNEWDSQDGRYPRKSVMTATELRELHAGGMVDVGSHGIDHLSMRRLERDDMKTQAVGSRNFLENLLGCSVRLFCYPYGRFDDFSRETATILSRAGYELAATTVWGTRNAREDALRLRRISLQEDDDDDDLKARIDGDYDWIGLRMKTGFVLRRVRARVNPTTSRQGREWKKIERA